ncbi:MAG TPA: triose-phosphate isomerase [Candidatus Hydrothermia bacterium]|nr:triose-phosphate isomerase [Candidatus Hydrothermae bacterium]MDD3649668.1 triose-phosphate isomerase [Candidatus Hydrothermia bacterium]MDD5572986.1 triose-phosphate isomerase [Candidatus Hydrothermia bacterium]HRD23223.1 triose-phosphate isomerase [Candidatus Hydrothermia bacterium]
MREKIIAGNWKMYMNHVEAVKFINDLQKELKRVETAYEIAVFPPFTSLFAVSQVLDKDLIKLGAQNTFYEKEGAYTGEVSVSMLKAIGCDYVIVGHSERRKYFYEDDAMIALKIKASLEGGITPILCVGETLEEREKGKAKEVVKQQMEEDLRYLSKEDIRRIVIAYEPVWAIGTGKNATPEEAQEMHEFVRETLNCQFGFSEITILYGGSVKPENIGELTRMKDVDGALVGGASIKLDSFLGIIKNVYQGGD